MEGSIDGCSLGGVLGKLLGSTLGASEGIVDGEELGVWLGAKVGLMLARPVSVNPSFCIIVFSEAASGVWYQDWCMSPGFTC